MNFIFSSGFVILVIFALIVSSFRVLREYERGVVFLFGRFWRVKGPGPSSSSRRDADGQGGPARGGDGCAAAGRGSLATMCQ